MAVWVRADVAVGMGMWVINVISRPTRSNVRFFLVLNIPVVNNHCVEHSVPKILELNSPVPIFIVAPLFTGTLFLSKTFTENIMLFSNGLHMKIHIDAPLIWKISWFYTFIVIYFFKSIFGCLIFVITINMYFLLTPIVVIYEFQF